MGLALKVTGGSLNGSVFSITAGMTVGREGTIQINDRKVSTIHATIEREGDDWVLKDNQSKNGIRRVSGERIDVLLLKPGSAFLIGEYRFDVLAEAKPEQPQPQPQLKRGLLWNEALADFIESKLDSWKDKPRDMKPMEPALVLDFVRGIQVNARWVVGYGPRQIGAATLDLPIWEPKAPDICFEVQPTKDGILFVTKHPKIVLLNGREIDRQILRMGDSIRIYETLIEVDFTE